MASNSESVAQSYEASNKRRRLSNNNNHDIDDDEEEKTVQVSSKCKGATTIPIFLKSKYHYTNHTNLVISM